MSSFVSEANSIALAHQTDLLSYFGITINRDKHPSRNPFRQDSNLNSIIYDDKTGRFMDFAGDNKGHSLVDLVNEEFNLHDLHGIEAARWIHERYGSISYPTIPKSSNKDFNKDDWQQIVPAPTTLPEPYKKDATFEKRYIYHTKEGGVFGLIDRFILNESREVFKDNNLTTNNIYSVYLNKPKKSFNQQVYAEHKTTRIRKWIFYKLQEFPLYNLHLIAQYPQAEILLVSGEKCADSVNELFKANGYRYLAITWRGGDKAIDKMDFSPLQGRNVICWPDNDDSSKNAMAKLGLAMLTPPPNKNKGWDVADAVEECWTYEDIENFIDTALPYQDTTPPLSGKNGSSADISAQQEDFSDKSLAIRAVKACKGNLKYMVDRGLFAVWQGDRWAIDNHDIYAAPMIMDCLYDDLKNEEQKATTHAAKKEFNKWATKVCNTTKNNTIMAQVKRVTEIHLYNKDLDANDWLLNVKNGTIDLKAKIFRRHSREDFITKIIDLNYKPKATAKLWNETLERFLPNEETRNFHHKAQGYSISGSTAERCFFVQYGVGRNGKSTITDTIRNVLGPYGSVANDNLLFENKYGSKNEGLADVAGSRFLSADENSKNAVLNVPLLKKAAAGGKQKARFLFQNEFEFQFKMKIWLSTNHKPNIPDNNEAIWDRIHLIPFSVRISDDERIGNFEDLLKTEYEGILNWLIEGCYKWQTEGLKKPSEVAEATNEYRETEDIIGNFIRETYNPIVDGMGGWVKASIVYGHYKKWCEDNNYRPMNSTRLGIALKESGLEKHKSNIGIMWQIGTVKESEITPDELPLSTESKLPKPKDQPVVVQKQEKSPPKTTAPPTYEKLKSPPNTRGCEDFIF
jgi:putative DNA primase/helicase